MGDSTWVNQIGISLSINPVNDILKQIRARVGRRLSSGRSLPCKPLWLRSIICLLSRGFTAQTPPLIFLGNPRCDQYPLRRLTSGMGRINEQHDGSIHQQLPTSSTHSLEPLPYIKTLYAKMNPFTAGGWGTSSGNPPSIFGALPSVPVSSSAPRSIQADSVQFKLTNFNTTVLNCTVVGPQNHVVYRVVTNSGAPSSTMWKDNESRNVGMVTWQPNATLEVRGVASRQRVRDWLRLSSDQRFGQFVSIGTCRESQSLTHLTK